MIVYQVNNLSFNYNKNGIPAINGLNLSIKQGEFIGITGPTGAGKSTLVKCLNGIIPHYQNGVLAGQVLLLGQSISEISLAKIARIVGSVFDDPEAQIVAMDVEQELAFGLENLGVEPAIINERITEALRLTGINNLRHCDTAALSGGQKQRLAIAAVLALKPEVLILDEPTSELDPIGTKEIFQVLKELNQRQHITIIVVEQKTEFLARYASRILVMNGGRIQMDDSPRQVFSDIKKLTQLGVQPPQILDLAHQLGLSHLQPITVAEGIKIINEVFYHG
ncbi:ABC transporter ATP-binding protein [Peptococcaceae bacterium 1198_IL3148]